MGKQRLKENEEKKKKTGYRSEENALSFSPNLMSIISACLVLLPNFIKAKFRDIEKRFLWKCKVFDTRLCESQKAGNKQISKSTKRETIFFIREFSQYKS